jgi:hypothetical protein
MQQQRISTKVVNQINKLHPYLDSSSRKGSSFLGSGSSYSSSIEERKSRGQYFQFPEKTKRKLKQVKPIEEKDTKVVSTCTEEDEDDSEDVFWR